jgi:hypothetical protein
MKTGNKTTNKKKGVGTMALRLAAVITIVNLLTGLGFVAPHAVSAQRDARRPVQGGRQPQPDVVRSTTNPHIVSVTGLKETTPGVARILPHTEFIINGQNFATQKGSNKILVLKRVFDEGITRSQNPNVSERERYDVVATIAPLSMTANKLTAKIVTELAVGEYFLQVEVVGMGKGNRKPVEVSTVNFNRPRKLKISIDQNSAKPGEQITVKGNFNHEGYTYKIWIYHQPDRTYRFPLTTKLSGGDFTVSPIVGELPMHSKSGGYDVMVRGADLRRSSPTYGAFEESNTLNFTVAAVSLDYHHQFEVEFRGFECFKESADGPGSDETYMAALVYHDNQRDHYTPHGSTVFDSVDANDKRIEPIRFLTFGLTAEDVAYDPKRRHFGLDRFVMVVALGEYDGDAKWHGTHIPSITVAKDAAYVINDHGSRNQIVEKVKNSMRTMIDNALDGFSEDDCLGVEELTFTQAELQKAVYLNGQPLEKSLHFRGDDSHYRAIFHLRLVKPIKK